MKQNGVNKRRTIIAVTEAVETTPAARSFLIPAAAGNWNGRSREEEFDSKKISTSRGYRPNLKPRTVQQVKVSSR